MPYVKNLEEIVPVLKGRLMDYLSLRLGRELAPKSRFPCFIHEGDDDNMGFSPKTNYEHVKCFSCNASADIFTAAASFDGLPLEGPTWVTETIPALCELLGVKVVTGDPSPLDAERGKLFAIARDIEAILIDVGDPSGYAAKRNWEQEDIPFGCATDETIISRMVDKGWEAQDVNRSMLVRTSTQSFFGEDRLTFSIRDDRGRACGFVSRNTSDKGPKYLNTPESLIYQKSKILLGLDTAIQEAKRSGLYIVEGPGDLAQLKRLGIANSAATCGTALTVDHLLTLKSLGIRHISLCLDWDDAGTTATDRIFFQVLKQCPGFSVQILCAPEGNVKDVDELLHNKIDASAFLALKHVPAFEWVLSKLSDNESPDLVCNKMIPIIASELTAVTRELLAKKLSEYTSISYMSIISDVNAIRNRKFEERRERLTAAADQYTKEVAEDPDNITAIFAQHENLIERIEKEYNRDQFGANYQTNRYDSIQTQRALASPDQTGFRMSWLPCLARALSGGASWSSGCLMYVGGRANSGKTALVTTIATDVAMTDPDTMVIIHTTDDSYEQVEPRIKSIVARMLYKGSPNLSIGMVVNPRTELQGYGQEYYNALQGANDQFRALLADEKLALIDAEDGNTMSTLEKHVRYYRSRYPSKKLLIIADNLHNYGDFYNLDQTQRITQLANLQKQMVNKYHACLISTAEYRKNLPKDPSKLVLPVDDDLADARALMFRPNVIMHVYNDLHDRHEFADTFWVDGDQNQKPRLLINVTKNKVSSFKDKLVVDLDPQSVTLAEVSAAEARKEVVKIANLRADDRLQVRGKKVIIEADEYFDDDGELTEAGRRDQNVYNAGGRGERWF